MTHASGSNLRHNLSRIQQTRHKLRQGGGYSDRRGQLSLASMYAGTRIYSSTQRMQSGASSLPPRAQMARPRRRALCPSFSFPARRWRARRTARGSRLPPGCNHGPTGQRPSRCRLTSRCASAASMAKHRPTAQACTRSDSTPVSKRPCGKQRPIWPAGIHAAQAAACPRLAGARGSLRHDLALTEASGEPSGRGLSHRVFHTGTLSTRTC